MGGLQDGAAYSRNALFYFATSPTIVEKAASKI